MVQGHMNTNVSHISMNNKKTMNNFPKVSRKVTPQTFCPHLRLLLVQQFIKLSTGKVL